MVTAATPLRAVGDAPDLADEPRPPAFTDEALALRFAEEHEADLRYVAPWGRWFHFDGSRWRPDDTLLAFDLARRVCRRAAAECNKPKVAKLIASAKTTAAVERLAKADRRLAATIDQWDADPWLLNTPGGVVELRTGRMRPHRRENYLTKITAAAPGGAWPVWRAHLLRIMAGDAEMVAYLQRVFGYSLTGSTREHALFFGFGVGANGKTVTISTVAGVLGDYHRAASVETFTASSNDRHPTELAGLRGARLVTASETEQGRRWAESRIKMLTGGERVEARFMRQDFFEFTPQLKLWISGNHKPGLNAVDEAIRRRFHMAPFTVTIPASERDETLTDRLQAEWPGILDWMIEGCLAWQRDGLSPPAAVRCATDAYLRARTCSVSGWPTSVMPSRATPGSGNPRERCSTPGLPTPAEQARKPAPTRPLRRRCKTPASPCVGRAMPGHGRLAAFASSPRQEEASMTRIKSSADGCGHVIRISPSRARVNASTGTPVRIRPHAWRAVSPPRATRSEQGPGPSRGAVPTAGGTLK
jgi:putative DNA primase/helicase